MTTFDRRWDDFVHYRVYLRYRGQGHTVRSEAVGVLAGLLLLFPGEILRLIDRVAEALR